MSLIDQYGSVDPANNGKAKRNGHKPASRLQNSDERTSPVAVDADGYVLANDDRPRDESGHVIRPGHLDYVEEEKCGLQVVGADEIEPREIVWYWKPRLAKGKVTVFAGDPELGKSFISGAFIPAAISIGAAWPDGSGMAPHGKVLILSGEDSIEDTLIPRLIANGADRSQVKFIEAVTGRDEKTGKEISRSVRLDLDLRQVELYLEQNPGFVVLVIDPIGSYLGKTDSHKNSEVRAVLEPLGKLAEKFGLAVITVLHLNKSGNGPALYRASGSLAFVAHARTAFAFVRDADDRDRVLFLHLKNNLHKPAPGLAYRIIDGRVIWDTDTVSVTVDQAMRNNAESKGGDKLAEAQAWLKTRLADGLPVESNQLADEAKAAGIAFATMKRAKGEICDSEKERGKKGGKWFVKLKDEHLEPHEKVEPLEPLEPLLNSEESQEVQQSQEDQEVQEAHGLMSDAEWESVAKGGEQEPEAFVSLQEYHEKKYGKRK